MVACAVALRSTSSVTTSLNKSFAQRSAVDFSKRARMWLAAALNKYCAGRLRMLLSVSKALPMPFPRKMPGQVARHGGERALRGRAGAMLLSIPQHAGWHGERRALVTRDELSAAPHFLEQIFERTRDVSRLQRLAL
jgi:hypothetical protein